MTLVLLVVTIVASVWGMVNSVRTNRRITENLDYAARMSRAATSISLGIEDDDVAWYRTNPPLPGDRS
jgi:ABC-type microcin C transport system permease subunit YejE